MISGDYLRELIEALCNVDPDGILNYDVTNNPESNLIELLIIQKQVSLVIFSHDSFWNTSAFISFPIELITCMIPNS